MAGGRLPVVNGSAVLRALKRAGFNVDRIVGSHHVLVFPGDPTRTVTVPVHSGRDLKPGTLRAIIREAGFSVEEFKRPVIALYPEFAPTPAGSAPLPPG